LAVAAILLLTGLRGVLGLLQAEAVHVDLVGHICDVLGSKWVVVVGSVGLVLCKCLCRGTCVVSYKERLQRDTEDCLWREEWYFGGGVRFE
jgi:hypothetical protein